MIPEYKVFSIDPGTNYLGWAVYKNKHTLSDFGLVTCKFSNHIDRTDFILKEVMRIFRKFMASSVAIELPEYWSGSVGFAARESGSVFKLSLLVGGLYGIFRYNDIAKVHLINPSDWKGQMKKEMAHSRLNELGILTPDYKRRLENIKPNTDTMDAIGIGYYFLGGKI